MALRIDIKDVGRLGPLLLKQTEGAAKRACYATARRVVNLMEVQRVVAERGRAVGSDRALAEHIASTTSPFFAARLREQASKTTPAALETMLANLRWADLKLKTTSLDSRSVVEEALLAAHVGKRLASAETGP